MEMNIHHDSKTVDIWLTGSEARDESFRRSLEPYYRQFAKHKYFVSVFESGDRELLPDTVLLLRHNLELQMNAEPATEQVQALKNGAGGAMPSALLHTLLCSAFHRFQFFRAVIGTTKTPSGRTYAALESPVRTDES